MKAVGRPFASSSPFSPSSGSSSSSSAPCPFCSVPGHSQEHCNRFKAAQSKAQEEVKENRKKKKAKGKGKANAAQETSQDAAAASAEFAGAASVRPSTVPASTVPDH